MNKKQKTIATSMEKLLDRMYKAGLKGGVFVCGPKIRMT